MSNYAKRKQAEAEVRKKEIKRAAIIGAIVVAVIALFVGILIFLKSRPISLRLRTMEILIIMYLIMLHLDSMKELKLIR